MFYGLDWIATVPPTVRLTSEAFGRENTGVIYGWIGASHQLGASMAAFGAGAIRTRLGDYQLAFWIAGGLCLLAGMSFLTIGRRARAARRRSPRHAGDGARLRVHADPNSPPASNSRGRPYKPQTPQATATRGHRHNRDHKPPTPQTPQATETTEITSHRHHRLRKPQRPPRSQATDTTEITEQRAGPLDVLARRH